MYIYACMYAGMQRRDDTCNGLLAIRVGWCFSWRHLYIYVHVLIGYNCVQSASPSSAIHMQRHCLHCCHCCMVLPCQALMSAVTDATNMYRSNVSTQQSSFVLPDSLRLLPMFVFSLYKHVSADYCIHVFIPLCRCHVDNFLFSCHHYNVRVCIF